MRSITGQTLVARFESRYAVIVHGETHPTASDWARIVEAYRETLERDKLRVLVYTHGGAPTPPQRAEVNSVFGQTPPRIAVLTSSVLARVAAKAVQLWVRELRIFDTSQIEPALDHLLLQGPDRASARSTLESLRHEFAARSSSRTP